MEEFQIFELKVKRSKHVKMIWSLAHQNDFITKMTFDYLNINLEEESCPIEEFDMNSEIFF